MPEFIRCHIPTCPAGIHPPLPFCRTHWRLVPQPLRSAVWEAWRPMTQSWEVPAYRVAVHAAVVAVISHEEGLH